MKSKLTGLAVFCILLFSNTSKLFAQEVSYYFAAHEDDWQLFMGTGAVNDASYAKVVFVTLTAGDAGWGSGGDGSIPYYNARENGSVKSAQFIANIGQEGSKLTQSNATVKGHKIKRYAYKNVVCYYLRLPDGNVDGSGFAGEDAFQSLQKLRTGQITQMTAVDNTTTYTSWLDLCNTLKAIINREKGADPQVYINIPDTDMGINPGDHSDHYNTGFAAERAVSSLSWVGIASWIDYHTADLAPNLSTAQIEDAAAMHACDVVGATEGGYFSNWEPGHNAWLDKDYFRVKRSPTGSSLLATASVDEDLKIESQNGTFISNVYPNPAGKNVRAFNIEVDVKQPGKVKLYLESASGALVSDAMEKYVHGKDKITIPLKSGLPAGVYYLTAVLDNKIKESRKVVIEK